MKLLFSHSRSSLYFSLKLISLKKNETILIPDYNCNSFMTSIRKLSINYKTYSINSDLRFNINNLKRKVTKNIKAIVIVNYFGVPLQINKMAKFCKKKKIFLINDNAHGASGTLNKKKIINQGDIGFESYHKIFDKIQSLSVLSINNKKLQQRFLMNKFNQKFESDYLSRFLFLIKIKIKNILFRNLRFKKINTENKFENVYLNKSISKFDLNFYKEINFNKEKKTRHDRINLIFKIIQNFQVKPLHKKLNKTLMIWYFPIKNYNSEFLSYLKINKIPYIQWPTFPNELISQKNKNIKKNIICLPLDHNYYDSK